MGYPLRQSTSGQTVRLGPFVSSSDGDTAMTSLTIANTDIRLSKNGGTTHVDKNSGGATHDDEGVYYCTLDDTDTDTAGGLDINVHSSGALAVKVECTVYSQDFYDLMFSSTELVSSLGGTSGSNLDSIPWNSSWDAEVESEVQDALAAYQAPTSGSIQLVVDILEANVDIDAVAKTITWKHKDTDATLFTKTYDDVGNTQGVSG